MVLGPLAHGMPWRIGSIWRSLFESLGVDVHRTLHPTTSKSSASFIKIFFPETSSSTHLGKSGWLIGAMRACIHRNSSVVPWLGKSLTIQISFHVSWTLFLLISKNWKHWARAAGIWWQQPWCKLWMKKDRSRIQLVNEESRWWSGAGAISPRHDKQVHRAGVRAYTLLSRLRWGSWMWRRKLCNICQKGHRMILSADNDICEAGFLSRLNTGLQTEQYKHSILLNRLTKSRQTWLHMLIRFCENSIVWFIKILLGIY